MILLLIVLQILPQREFLVYRTNDKGKLGRIEITSQRDSLGYHIIYTSDRIIEAILDTTDLGTEYLTKIVAQKLELKISNEKNFRVYFKGSHKVYHEQGPIYDRHTLDFALRGFEYSSNFIKRIRLHVPELMIINADLRVVGEETVISPLGEITCWKIEMAPRVIIIHLKFYFWIEKCWPYRFVKYSDSSGENEILLVEYQK